MPRFAREPELAILVDKIAKRYALTPLEVIEMDPEGLGLAIVCVYHADKRRADMINSLKTAGKGGMVPVPLPIMDIGEV